jgi:hypothetical protein
MTPSMTSPDNAKQRLADEALANPFQKTFVPQKKVTHTYGKTTIMVYPDTTASMGVHERSLAFNINKNAVKNAMNINHQSKLQIMGEKHDCTNLIEVEIEQWTSFGLSFLKNPRNLTVISYHDFQGAAIPDAINANGELKPIANGAVNDCRPNHVVYAKVKGIMDFASLNDSKPCTISATFFVRLQTTDHVVSNTANTPRNLHTFGGPSDWINLAAEPYHLLIYEHPESIQDPFELVPPMFSSPQASVDTDTKIAKITSDIIKGAYDRILTLVFKQICPNFIDDPFDTLNKINQETTLADGNKHQLTVFEYHSTVQIVITTFPREPDAQWAANPFRRFVEGLSPSIRDKMETNGFRKHTQAASTRPHDQIRLIQEAFEAACLAETELAKQRIFIQNQMRETHGFIAIPQGHTPVPTLMTSSAEQVLSKFRDENKKLCWGCMSEDHQYYDKRKKKVVCPNNDDPEVQARAEIVRKDFLERSKKARDGRRSSNPRGNNQSSQKKALQSLVDLLSPDKSKDTEPDANNILLNAIRSIQKGNSSSSDPIILLMGAFPVLQTSSNLPQLPISIQSTLPHINLRLGTKESGFNPCISAIVDTGAALCCGYSGYIMAIAKAYPELVKSITLAKDRYSPIVLNGVISKDDNDTLRFSTNLPAVVEFHLDYQTSSNQPISIKFATGEDVSVNCILGMSFIKAAKLIIDSHDNLVESKLLECQPFPIQYKHPIRSKPNLVQRDQPSTEKNLTVINAIEEACAFISTYVKSDLKIKPTVRETTALTFNFEDKFIEAKSGV